MANTKNKTILVHDSGAFFEIALALADHYKQVLYYVPWESGFPSPDKARVGTEWVNGKQLDTFDGKAFKRVPEFFEALKEADIVFFTDCYNGDLMEHLREMGYPVCGSGRGQILELDRWLCKQTFKAAGMDVNPMKRVTGMTALRELLKKEEDRYIKISRYRKLVETFHHETYQLSEAILDKMQHELGPMAETIEFIIEEPIEAIVEEGIDCYTVDGKYPNNTLAGTEVKDRAYYGEIMDYDKLSPGVQRTTNQISPMLKKYGYKGFFSTEVRTTKHDENFLSDFTARQPMPPSPLYTIMFENLGEIIWGIANGEIVDIKPKYKCGLYVTLYSDFFDSDHQPVWFPKEYRDNVKISYPIKVDGKYTAININGFPEVGSVVVGGNSFEECYKLMEKIAPEVKGYGLKIEVKDCEVAKGEFDKMMGKKS